MTEVYYLILVFTSVYGGVSSTHIAYSTEDACYTAAMEIRNKFAHSLEQPRLQVRWHCSETLMEKLQ